jgi:thiol-disulfide isomerase/thioredoxin
MKFIAASPWALLLAASQVVAAGLQDAAAIPQLGPQGVESYREFLKAMPHRAFAIAPGGSWSWQAELPSPHLAEQAARQTCQSDTQQTCVLYAVDDKRVFDAKAWPTLWGPYASAAVAAKAPVGVRRGERFPDLQFRDEQGKSQRVSDQRGKVLLLHFWGSWCGPCRRELPDLQKLVRSMAKETEIRFLFLPVRESFQTARDWAKAQKLQLPLFDAGEKEFMLADGTKVPDRQIAGKFPTTYVLDKHGLVVFSHIGDASRWDEYAPFLRDAMQRSGK